jgi:murein peptide amidase A
MAILLDPTLRTRNAAAVKSSALEAILDPLNACAERSAYLLAAPLRGEGLEPVELPRYIIPGPRGGGDPMRIGIFAAIHGDEPAGSHAVLDFVRRVEQTPGIVEGYQLFLYPVCNPGGLALGTRLSPSGKDLNREFWRNSSEPEVRLLENEIRSQSFHGLISLHADDTSNGLYGYVRGAVLTRALLEPALEAAERILPRNKELVIDGFPADNGIISKCFDGILASPPDLHPEPFEIILETPHRSPEDQQAEAFVVAIEAILAEYRKFLAFAANL